MQAATVLDSIMRARSAAFAVDGGITLIFDEYYAAYASFDAHNLMETRGNFYDAVMRKIRKRKKKWIKRRQTGGWAMMERGGSSLMDEKGR